MRKKSINYNFIFNRKKFKIFNTDINYTSNSNSKYNNKSKNSLILQKFNSRNLEHFNIIKKKLNFKDFISSSNNKLNYYIKKSNLLENYIKENILDNKLNPCINSKPVIISHHKQSFWNKNKLKKLKNKNFSNKLKNTLSNLKNFNISKYQKNGRLEKFKKDNFQIYKKEKVDKLLNNLKLKRYLKYSKNSLQNIINKNDNFKKIN